MQMKWQQPTYARQNGESESGAYVFCGDELGLLVCHECLARVMRLRARFCAGRAAGPLTAEVIEFEDNKPMCYWHALQLSCV